MMFAAIPIPLSACLLADHLDAVLAIGEDLLKFRGTLPRPGEDPVENILAARAAQRRAVECIRALEAALLARVMTARERAAELARADMRFKMMARLFASGTAVLADAVAECRDSTASDFETADGVTPYLRGRGSLPADAIALAENAEVAVDEGFLLGKQARLGVLMDLAAQFLDSLEEHFDLYGVDIDEVDAYANAAPRGETAGEQASGSPRASSDSSSETRSGLDSAEADEQARTGWGPGHLLAVLAKLQSEPERPESG